MANAANSSVDIWLLNEQAQQRKHLTSRAGVAFAAKSE